LNNQDYDEAMLKYDNDKMDKSMMNEHISYEDMINITIPTKKNTIQFLSKFSYLHYDHMVIQVIDLYLLLHKLDNRM
jgi:hypothetical protein